MQRVREVELHVTHACNLFCESCSHYSNQGLRGHLDPALAEAWLRDWSARLEVESFVLLGGEPTLHPNLAEFVPLVRRHWPASHLRIITNGFFLDRHRELPRMLQAAGNASLTLSVHHGGAAYRARLQPQIDLVNEWREAFGITCRATLSAANWTRRYHSSGSGIRPFADEDPGRSWDRCPCRSQLQIFRHALWKCPPLAYLPVLAEKHALAPEWNPYLAYQPLQADCGELELSAFLAREAESVCAMCPAAPARFQLPDPMRPPAPASTGASQPTFG